MTTSGDQNSRGNMPMRSGQRRPHITEALAAREEKYYLQRGIVPAVDRSATYVFENSVTAAILFARAYGTQTTLDRLKEEGVDVDAPKGHIYARISNPTISAVEARLHRLEPGAAGALVVPSGMSAVNILINSACHVRMSDAEDSSRLVRSSRDVVLVSPTLYGGTHGVTHAYMYRFGLRHYVIDPTNPESLRDAFERFGNRIALLIIETPANPTLDMIDIKDMADQIALLKDEFKLDHRPVLAVDNTFMGMFQQPLMLGADVVFYSCTKYMGGHSDLIGGALMWRGGNTCVMKMFNGDIVEIPLEIGMGITRTLQGYTVSPDMASNLFMHLDTYEVRMQRSADSATSIAEALVSHPKLQSVTFPSLLTGMQAEIFHKQCDGNGGMITIRLKDDSWGAAFRFMDAMRLFKQAVSLGSTISLVEHPSSQTHSDIPLEDQDALGIFKGLIRLSVGMEDAQMLLEDIEQALDKV